METSTVVWIVVALVAIAVLVAVAMLASKKKTEHKRNQAAELREKVQADSTELRRKEALAKESEAEAAVARAEAERRAAEAERLDAEAQDRVRTAEQHRDEHQEQLRRADELDPDVRHDAPTTAPAEGATAAAEGDGTHRV